MKLRIRDNTIRIRLTQGEVARLAAGQSVWQETNFGADQRLAIFVDAMDHLGQIFAGFEDNQIRVGIPLPAARDWANGEQISLEATQPVGCEKALHILIEKDFQCLHSAAEGEEDAYPNPRNK